MDTHDTCTLLNGIATYGADDSGVPVCPHVVFSKSGCIIAIGAHADVRLYYIYDDCVTSLDGRDGEVLVLRPPVEQATGDVKTLCWKGDDALLVTYEEGFVVHYSFRVHVDDGVIEDINRRVLVRYKGAVNARYVPPCNREVIVATKHGAFIMT